MRCFVESDLLSLFLWYFHLFLSLKICEDVSARETGDV